VAVTSCSTTQPRLRREEHRSRSYPLSQARGFRTAHLQRYSQGRPFLGLGSSMRSRRLFWRTFTYLYLDQNAAVEFR